VFIVLLMFRCSVYFYKKKISKLHMKIQSE